MINIKRVYDPPTPDDGERFLVDRLWPRGLAKDRLRLAGWLKVIAPTNELRKWYSHDPEKWEEFKRRYFSELDNQKSSLTPILDALKSQKKVTLLYSAKNEAINNAVALKEYLETIIL